MVESFVTMIKNYLVFQQRPIPFPPPSERNIEEVEKRLGFSLPPLLSSVYLKIGNGGFGPGLGGSIIGVKGGYASDFGTIDETYYQLIREYILEGKEWNKTLLPFCEWGCNIFSCVDCKEPDYPILLFEEGDLAPSHDSLLDFAQTHPGGI